MATLQASSFLRSWNSYSSRHQRGITRAAISLLKLQTSTFPFPKLQNRGLVEELYTNTSTCTTHIDQEQSSKSPDFRDPMVIEKLHMIMEAISDRIEMHKNMGEQRNNWNTLLLTSIHMVTLAAATMAGIGAASATGAPLVALKLSSTLMYLAVTGMLYVMNKIQPSQLVEEQRNAARLFKQLYEEIHTIMTIGNPNNEDVEEAMSKVLALDKAYPLPLLGVMLEKFPESVEPAVWWPKQRQSRRQVNRHGDKMDNNGWNEELEEEMKEVIAVVRKNDKEDYLRLGKKALRMNKALAMLGPLLTGLAAVGSAFVGSPHNSWAAMVGVTAGALASVVNTLEHGGQVGMVFEMYRSNAGFFELMEETIESNLNERDLDKRENGELFETKLALQLGRSLSELKELVAASSRNKEAFKQFASKLF